MNFLKSILVSALALCLPAGTDGSPYVISDDRVRNLDVTPVLGRGYSIMTNSFQSTCLEVYETNIPSFNYEYEFTDFSSSTSMDSEASSSLSGSFSWWWLRAQVSSNSSSSSSSEKVTNYIVASMKIQRYYASVKEETSKIGDMALQLLDRQDYVSFFKACGPTYVRSIRRAQEVTAVLKFESTSSESASEYSSSVNTNYGYNAGGSSSSKFASMSKSLTITIKGYGLGLTEGGSETLMATTIEQFNGVMKFAYNQMTKSPFANHVGMVYGIEVAPWIENIQFQITSKVQDEAIELPQAKSLIPLAYRITDDTDTDFNNDDADHRLLFRCKDLTYEIDKYGYCCESLSLYNYAEQVYDENDPHERICRPVRTLDKSMVTENMASNGEFVARLDSALRYKSNSLAVLEKCISAVNGIPKRFNHHYLASQDSVKYDKEVDGIFTVFDMRMSVDPFEDYAIVGHMAKELDEFIEMFYAPCLAALFGTNIGTSSSTDASYFMAYPWHTHDECSKLSCLASNMRWDSENGGCIPSLLSGANSKGYDGDQTNCAKSTEGTGDTETCKHDTEALRAMHNKTVTCWKAVLPSGSVSYFIEHFCMPSVTAKALSEAEKEAMETTYAENCA